MSDSPTTFFREVVPAQFQKGVEALRGKSGPGAKEALDDVLGSKGAVRLVIAGEGETWLVVENGTMRAQSDKPEGYPVRMAFGFTAEAAQGALDQPDGGQPGLPTAPTARRSPMATRPPRRFPVP